MNFVVVSSVGIKSVVCTEPSVRSHAGMALVSYTGLNPENKMYYEIKWQNLEGRLKQFSVCQ